MMMVEEHVFNPPLAGLMNWIVSSPLCWRELVCFPSPLAAGLFQSQMGTLSCVSKFSWGSEQDKSCFAIALRSRSGSFLHFCSYCCCERKSLNRLVTPTQLEAFEMTHILWQKESETQRWTIFISHKYHHNSLPFRATSIIVQKISKTVAIQRIRVACPLFSSCPMWFLSQLLQVVTTSPNKTSHCLFDQKVKRKWQLAKSIACFKTIGLPASKYWLWRCLPVWRVP